MVYDGSLEGLFAVLDGVLLGAPLPDRIRLVSGAYSPAMAGSKNPIQGDLFGVEDAGNTFLLKGTDPASFFESEGGAAKELSTVSADAFDTFIYGWMSEIPIAAELVRFAWKVISAARLGGRGSLDVIGSTEARRAAGLAASDRGDPAAEAALSAAFKVCREIDRLRGLLRFTPDSIGAYTALCAPDHFVLPGLAEHFSLRFGGIPWAVIDEKRRLALICSDDGYPRLIPAPRQSIQKADAWVNLWRSYHISISNESRRNPLLQKRFMPLRYRNYLNEL
ncbi:MAG: DUF4130 domain-containing protein [Treponema sp.]|nr:DUF4130 domain-containing protein [Treponema sp.]